MMSDSRFYEVGSSTGTRDRPIVCGQNDFSKMLEPLVCGKGAKRRKEKGGESVDQSVSGMLLCCYDDDARSPHHPASCVRGREGLRWLLWATRERATGKIQTRAWCVRGGP
jgi:hypothetical protein